jgi:hypothetical protein
MLAGAEGLADRKERATEGSNELPSMSHVPIVVKAQSIYSIMQSVSRLIMFTVNEYNDPSLIHSL